MAPANAESFHAAISALADQAGDSPAILALNRTPLRFVELLASVTRVRDTLNRLGIGRGDRIVAALPQGAETAACFVGVAACATYVPLNPDYTEDEFGRYLSRIRPKAVIVPVGGGAALRNAAGRASIRIIELQRVDSGPAGSFELRGDEARASAESAWAGAEDTALILLTSGTTSRPKLVPLKQRHLLALARAGKAHFAIDVRDRYLQTTPMFHGHGLKSGLITPLLAGAGVICGPKFDVRSFFESMTALRPTWYSATYTMHRAILDRIDDYRDVARNAQLRFICSGSGRIDPKVVRGLEQAFGAPVLDGYSMSEAGALTRAPLPPRARKPGTVGISVLNEIRIVDEHGRFVSGDVRGEIVVRGPSVFEGYLDDPEANAKAFLNGWFRTGDLGYIDRDGHVTITGRIKDLINRGGEKISPSEVESAIGENPAVVDVCVFGVPHPTLGEAVIAAVVLSEGVLASERSICTHAAARLAEFKVPRRILFTSSLPKGATGKVDRVALTRQYALQQAPTTPLDGVEDSPPPAVESPVANLWHKMLNSRHIARNVDFFEAGGDSLKAAELFVAIRQQFGVSISMRHILEEGSTIAGLSSLIERCKHERGRSACLPQGLVPLKADGDRPPLFAVPGSDGNPGSYIHFSRLLVERQPLYGLASRGLYGESKPLDRIEDIAADHVNTIRVWQPYGPYFLIGACFGGRVAYEMARQLEAAGDRVAVLAMLDPSPPFTNSRGQPRGASPVTVSAHGRLRLARFVARRLRMYASEFARLDGKGRARFVRAKLRLAREIVRHRDFFRGDPSEWHGVAVREANRAAGNAYLPGRYGGSAILVLTDGRVTAGQRNLRLDWLGLMPQCDAPHYVPGRDTGDMLVAPNVDALAMAVNKWLEDAHGQTLLPQSVSHLRLAIAPHDA
jgi:acyl-CoA synthetase (AMP-forming)/AMP-acid ligase II/thioesterase domain-containing protein/acyl carrier protein